MALIKVFNINEEIEERKKLSATEIENLDKLIKQFSKSKIGVQYFIQKEKVENKINKLLNIHSEDNFDEDNIFHIIDLFASDLLKAEMIKEKENYRRNKNIKSGIFIVEYTSEQTILLKLEEINTINEKDFSVDTSYSAEKDYFKVAIIPHQQISEENIKVKIIDANATIAKYWSEKFLELEPLNTDETNTKNFLSIIRKKKLFKADIERNYQLEIKKSIDQFLYNESEFTFEKLTQYFNKEISADYKYDDVFTGETLNFIDGNFKFDKNTIESHFRSKLRLNDQVTINVNDYVDAIESGFLKLSDDGDFLCIRYDDLEELKRKLPGLVGED